MRKVIIAGMIGNALEWYDFALYGHFALILSKHFFPSYDPYVGLIATYSIFAAGFIMRPIGGIIFGYIGDKYGRRTSLAISIMMMAIPTACIGLLPTYASIGILAPILLALIRLIQGASIGGEFSGCIAFLVEYAPVKRRGLVGSVSMMSLTGGMLLGSIVATTVAHSMPQADFESWGWRIPFLIGLVVGLIGIYVRTGLHESPIYVKAKESNDLSSKPVREIASKYMPELILAVGIYLTVTVPFYTLTIFVKSYMTKTLNYNYIDSLQINLLSLAVATLTIPMGAWFSDKYGRKPVMKYTTLSIIIFMYPIFWLLKQTGIEVAVVSQVIFSALVGFYMGPIPAALVELFPTRVRFTGVAVSYNTSVALFGGTAPLVGTWLVNNTRHDSVALYVVFFAVLTLLTLKYYRESYRNSIS
ncbi:MAG: MFS transporter [Alphaproteobacteria bacterium]|nr:MFS transporter [Alphaproteobacteria bacterium]